MDVMSFRVYVNVFQMDLAAAKKQDMEVDSVLNETVELSVSPDRERLVEPQAMKSWDFTTWKQCSEHLVTEHKVSLHKRC